MSKERLIRKVTLNASGLKGLTLEGTYESIKENKIVINSFKDGIKNPIHYELESAIADLRIYALEICGLTSDKYKELKNAERVELLAGTEVVSFEFEKGVTGWIKIKLSSRVFDTKYQVLATPKVDSSDGYHYFDLMMNNLDEILKEVDLYTKGLKKVTDEDLMMSYVRHGKDKNVDIDTLNSMTAEEKADYCQSVLEKLGCLVIRPDEVYEEGETEEVSLETKAEEHLTLGLGTEIHEESGPFPDFSEALNIAEPIKLKK